jgi:hypothetical protein
MALKGAVVITATKIVDGPKQRVAYSGSGKDAIVILNDGSMYIGQVAFDDLNTGISATDETGS